MCALLQDGLSSEPLSAVDAAKPGAAQSGSSTVQNGHQSNTETEDSLTNVADDKSKLKKWKKDKSYHANQVADSFKDDIQHDISALTCDVLTASQTKKEKKKKKKRHQEDVADTEASVCENGEKNVLTATDGGHDKKSAKKRKHYSDVQGTGENDDAGHISKHVKTTEGKNSVFVMSLGIS